MTTHWTSLKGLFPVVQGAVLLVSAFFVLSNLIVDLLYAVIDPRIRYS